MKLIRIRVLKITQEPHTQFWYSSMVGQYVPLVGLDNGFWRSRERDGMLNFVAEGHARPVWALVKPEDLQRYPYVFTPEAREQRWKATENPTGQSRRHSAYEAAASVAVGFVASAGITAVLMPSMGHSVTLSENLLMTSVFTVASLARAYVLRRVFNRWAA